jgi:hypothetical protein
MEIIEDNTEGLPLWAQLRLENDFADESERKQIEILTVDKHTEIADVYTCLPHGCTSGHGIPCIWGWTV